MDIILASASPRRSELLKMLGLDFRIITSDAEDDLVYKEEIICSEKAVIFSKTKAYDVFEKLSKENVTSNALIIGADTIVTLDPNSPDFLGKPKDNDDAFNMLKQLSGRKHYVITGVCVINKATGEIMTDYEQTEVRMSNYSDEDIISYIKTNEPKDKAGAYGIQGFGSLLVEGIEGCYFNVVGLPVNLVSRMLKKNGYNIFDKINKKI